MASAVSSRILQKTDANPAKAYRFYPARPPPVPRRSPSWQVRRLTLAFFLAVADTAENRHIDVKRLSIDFCTSKKLRTNWLFTCDIADSICSDADCAGVCRLIKTCSRAVFDGYFDFRF